MKSLPGAALSSMLLAAATFQQAPTFRSSVDVIAVPVTVTERNRPVGNLTSADFELFDNGVRQEFSFATVDAMPADITLLIDSSGSVAGKALERMKSEIHAMGALLLPTDRVRLLSFARQATDAFGFVPGGATLNLDRVASGGVTALYDALVMALASQPVTSRPQLLFVLTDGRDNASFTNVSHVIAAAQSSASVLVFVLVESSNPLVREGGEPDAADPLAGEQSTVNVAGGSGRLIPGVNLPVLNSGRPGTTAITRSAGPYKGGPNLSGLKQAAEHTGGTVQADSSRVPLHELFRGALDNFRASYLLTFVPTGVEPRGTHNITVRTKNPRYEVRARRTYERR